MEVSEPIHQRVDYLSKILGVILVAVGIDRFRGDQVQDALFYILLGAFISLVPFFIDIKKAESL